MVIFFGILLLPMVQQTVAVRLLSCCVPAGKTGIQEHADHPCSVTTSVWLSCSSRVVFLHGGTTIGTLVSCNTRLILSPISARLPLQGQIKQEGTERKKPDVEHFTVARRQLPLQREDESNRDRTDEKVIVRCGDMVFV